MRTRRDDRRLQQAKESVLEMHPCAIMVTNTDGIVEYVNRRTTELTGYTVDELIGRHVLSLDENDEVDEELWATVRAAASWEGVRRRVKKSGEPYRVAVAIRAIEAEDGDVTHFVAVNHDVTKQAAVEERLANSLETAHALLNAPDDTAILGELDGTITALNATAAKRLGGVPEELVGQNAFDLFPPDVAAYRRKRTHEVARTRKPLRFEDERDGRLYENRFYPVFDVHGSVARITVIARDVTEHRLAEETLRKSEARNRAIVEAIPDIMFRFDRDGTYLDFVPAKGMEPYLPPDEFIGKSLRDVLPGDLAEDFMRLLEDVLDTKTLRVHEFELPISGRLHQFETRLVPIDDGGGVLAVVRDVTEMKKLESDLQAARSELDRRVEARIPPLDAYGLTFRELMVLELIAEGKEDKEIAKVLGISHRTVYTHVTHLLRKMGAANRTEAAGRAHSEGLITDLSADS